jgi:hypothetical protein
MMKKSFVKIFIVSFSFGFANQMMAQYTFFNPEGAFAIEVSLQNTDLNRLPIYRNSISSLAVVGDYIIGGTAAISSKTPFLFSASISKREVSFVYDIEEVIPGQQQIPTGFCIGKNGELYAGTIANETGLTGESGGHLFETSIDHNGGINIKDLGIPVPGEGILALTTNTSRTMLFGITQPSGLFFTHHIATGETKQYADIVPSKEDLRVMKQYALAPRDYLCRALVEGSDGMIYGSALINRIFYFNPEEEHFSYLEDNLPEVWGRKTMGSVESWTESRNGMIYGGNSGDGQLFELNTRTKTVKNLGKPIMMNRLRGLATAGDGKIYGIAGGAPGYAHLFSYDEKVGFVDLGNPEFEMKAPGIEQGILWRGFQLGTIASSEDGKYIVMGEDESLSQLFIFPIKKQ